MTPRATAPGEILLTRKGNESPQDGAVSIWKGRILAVLDTCELVGAFARALVWGHEGGSWMREAKCDDGHGGGCVETRGSSSHSAIPIRVPIGGSLADFRQFELLVLCIHRPSFVMAFWHGYYHRRVVLGCKTCTCKIPPTHRAQHPAKDGRPCKLRTVC